MSRKVRITVVQLPAWLEGNTPVERYQHRCQTVLRWIEQAGAAGVDLICLGETCTGEEVIEDAFTSAFTRQAAALAATYKTNLILPIAALVHGVRRNVALVIDRSGTMVGHYLKVHPTRREMSDGVISGDELPVFNLDFGCVGVAICHDLSFPESTRVLALRGAEIIVWPTWWSGWGEELCYAVIRSRAIDNGAWLVTASFGIPDHEAWRPGMILGRSGVIGPDGLILSSAGRYVGMAITEVDLDKPRLAHSFVWGEDGDVWSAILGDRRPDVYGAIVDPDLVIPAIPPSERTLRAVRGQIPATSAPTLSSEPTTAPVT